MSDQGSVSYVAWNGETYAGSPPEGWYLATDGRWWAPGSGPGPMPMPGAPPAPPPNPPAAVVAPASAGPLFEAGTVTNEDAKSDGLCTVILTASDLTVESKRGLKRYPMSKVTGYSQGRATGKFKVRVQISAEDDLNLSFGGLRGPKNADRFVETLKTVL